MSSILPFFSKDKDKDKDIVNDVWTSNGRGTTLTGISDTTSAGVIESTGVIEGFNTRVDPRVKSNKLPQLVRIEQDLARLGYNLIVTVGEKTKGRFLDSLDYRRPEVLARVISCMFQDIIDSYEIDSYETE